MFAYIIALILGNWPIWKLMFIKVMFLSTYLLTSSTSPILQIHSIQYMFENQTWT